jgi:hypothetical protein
LSLDELLIIGLTVLGAIVAVIVVYVLMKKQEKKSATIVEEESFKPELRGLPFKVSKSVSSENASKAKGELRILELEREILSDAIRRLYEAHAEGKITEDEREKLAETYKSRMMSVRESISKDESVVALHELEAMQEDLIKLFSERFGDISTKIDELRTKVEARPIKEVAIPTVKLPSEIEEEEEEEKPEEKEKREKKRKRAPPKPSPKSQAEKRIEEIRAEVEKVLDRLGQMEIEG